MVQNGLPVHLPNSMNLSSTELCFQQASLLQIRIDLLNLKGLHGYSSYNISRGMGHNLSILGETAIMFCNI